MCDLAHRNSMNLFNLVRRSDCAACKIDEIVDVAPLRSRKAMYNRGTSWHSGPSKVSNRYHNRGGGGSDGDDGAILSSEIRSAGKTGKFANTADVV